MALQAGKGPSYRPLQKRKDFYSNYVASGGKDIPDCVDCAKDRTSACNYCYDFDQYEKKLVGGKDG